MAESTGPSCLRYHDSKTQADPLVRVGHDAWRAGRWNGAYHMIARIFSVFVVVLTGLMGSGCTTNQATGKSQLNLISTEREVALGSEASPRFLQEYGDEIPSPEIRRYVSDLGHRLAAVSERPELPWEFHVVDSAVLNAFALPGGKVFISRGLLVRLSNEAQLAGVLGHEVGHVTAQHIGQQMTQGMVVQGLAAGLGAAAEASDEDWLKALGLTANVGGSVYLLKFGRDQELEADWLALRYMTKLGYHPTGHTQVLQILRDASQGQARPPELLSTHPLPDKRISQIEERIKKDYPKAAEPNAYEFRAESFKSQVMDRLKTLPPPKHGGSAARLDLPLRWRTTPPDVAHGVSSLSYPVSWYGGSRANRCPGH